MAQLDLFGILGPAEASQEPEAPTHAGQAQERARGRTRRPSSVSQAAHNTESPPAAAPSPKRPEPEAAVQPAPSVLPPPATLADVLARLASAPDLSDTRRRDLASAVRRMERFAGRPLASILARPAEVRGILDGMVLADHGITLATFAKLRSNVTAALVAAGVDLHRTSRMEVTPEWSVVLDAAPDDATRYALSRCARLCSSWGIAPRAVTVETFARLEQVLLDETAVRQPTKVAQDARRAWIRLAAARPGLGLTPVPVVADKGKRARVPWSAFPQPLQDEVVRLRRWFSDRDDFAPDARIRPLKPSSAHLRINELQSAASALVTSGVPIESLTSLSQLVEPAAFRAILIERQHQSGGRANTYNIALAKGLIRFAKEWVQSPAADIEVLKRMLAKVPKPAPGLVEKNQDLLRRFDDPNLVHRLLALPRRVFDEGKRLNNPVQRLAHLQAGLLLAILLDMPVRLANATGLELGTSLHLPAAPNGKATLQIAAEKVKNGQPLVAPLSQETTRMIREYVDRLAPDLLGERPRFLFASRRGGPGSQDALGDLFVRTVERQLGVHVTPHQVRHLAAKLILDREPGNYELVRQLLGHKSLDVTTRAYTGLNTARAARHHQTVLADAREQLVQRGRRRTGR